MEILPEPNAHPSELKVHEVQYTMADSTIASLTTSKFKSCKGLQSSTS